MRLEVNRIYRVKRTSERSGNVTVIYHADVIANNPVEAKTAAENGKVTNWRVIRRLDDVSSVDKDTYEVIRELDEDFAVRPKRPIE